PESNTSAEVISVEWRGHSPIVSFFSPTSIPSESCATHTAPSTRVKTSPSRDSALLVGKLLSPPSGVTDAFTIPRHVPIRPISRLNSPTTRPTSLVALHPTMASALSSARLEHNTDDDARSSSSLFLNTTLLKTLQDHQAPTPEGLQFVAGRRKSSSSSMPMKIVQDLQAPSTAQESKKFKPFSHLKHWKTLQALQARRH
ncbi:hypothetical protein FB45DRAFT_15471, partial [Roridomyces roridus]